MSTFSPAARDYREGRVTDKDVIAMCREWIDNLSHAFGESTVMNYLPNSTGGRVWIEEALKESK